MLNHLAQGRAPRTDKLPAKPLDNFPTQLLT
jgi:hypothetical protein